MQKVILIIDDSMTIRQMVTYVLKCANYDVMEAVDGQDALEKTKEKTIHLILTDQNMPRMDGLTFIKIIRTFPHCKGIPILMLTTEASDAMKMMGRAAGATGWLVKPFDPDKLLDVVRKVIG